MFQTTNQYIYIYISLPLCVWIHIWKLSRLPMLLGTISVIAQFLLDSPRLVPQDLWGVAEIPPECRYTPKCQRCRASSHFRFPGPLGQDPTGSGRKTVMWHPPNSQPVTSTAGNNLEGPRASAYGIPMTWNQEQDLYWWQTRINR